MRVHLQVQTLSLGLILGFAIDLPAIAQPLPPPPNTPAIPTPNAPLPTVNPAPNIPGVDGTANPNERVYTAPVNPVQPVGGQFRVYVDADSPYVLQQVRAIQPDAFIQNFAGRRVIQAGLFNDELKARQQISRLSAQGIAAEMTTRSPQPGFEQAASGYYAVIPGNSGEVQNYRDRAIQIGISQSLVQIRDRPRGLHLAVGPFASKREAEQAVRYLRDRGSLDARLFYDR